MNLQSRNQNKNLNEQDPVNMEGAELTQSSG